MMDELPELTDEERAAMDSMDMTWILGTPEERCIRAESFALRMFRERNELRARLAEVEADNARLRESLKAERDAVKRLNERSATAEESARWLLYDAPGRPCTEVDEFVRERPWLNCLKSSKSSGGE